MPTVNEKTLILAILVHIRKQFPLTLTINWNSKKELTLEEENKIIKEYHNSDAGQHLGENKTIHKIRQHHNWDHLDQDVINFLKNCMFCQQNKLNRIRNKMEPVIPDTPQKPNDKIAMDIYGPLTKTKQGNQYILSIQDVLTKYLMLIPLPNTKAQTIIPQLINHYIYTFSSPKNILTDQGKNFVGQLMMQFEQNFNIEHIKTTAFHPQSNGSLERAHAVVKDLIRTCTADKRNEWDENLNAICYGYNTSLHETTGYSPFELTFGYPPNTPSSIPRIAENKLNNLVEKWKRIRDKNIERAREITHKHKEKYKRIQEKEICKVMPTLKITDKVYLYNSHKKHKLDTEWLGPYEITKVNIPNYEIKINNELKLAHGSRLKPVS